MVNLPSKARRRFHQSYTLLSLRCLLALVVSVTLLPRIARAQEASPITVQISAGYENHYRTNQWFPISITIANTGPDVSGVLEWRFPGQIAGPGEDRVLRRAVDLPQGANKRLTLAALSSFFARSGELRLLVDNSEVLKQTVQIEPGDPSQFMIGVLSSDPALLNSLSSMRMVNSSATSISHLDPLQMPDEATTLLGLDAIFVHDLPDNALTERQRAALALWVRLGGQLIVSGCPSADRNASGLAALLPVDIGDLRSNVSLSALAALPRTTVSEPPPSTTVSAVQLRSGASSIDRDSLLISRSEGMGQVLFSAFDLAALHDWSGESQMWARVLSVSQRFLPGSVYHQQPDNLLQNVLQLPALQLPSFGSLLAFIVLYIVVLGPINYLVLKRLKRPEFAWLTIPATVLLFVLGTYIYGFVVRGGRAQVSQLAVVQAVEGQGQGQATAFVGLFSPRRRSYDLQFRPEALVSEVRGSEFSGGGATIVWRDSATDLANTLVDVSSLRTFMYEQAVDVPVLASSALQRDDQHIGGQVINRGSEPLEDALLVSGDAAQSLGTIAPGAAMNVDLRLNRSNFPNSTSLAPEEGIFNRRNVLTSLFTLPAFGGSNTNNFQQGFPDRSGVYMLAWRPQPTADVSLDGSAATQQALTLYVVQLKQ